MVVVAVVVEVVLVVAVGWCRAIGVRRRLHRIRHHRRLGRLLRRVVVRCGLSRLLRRLFQRMLILRYEIQTFYSTKCCNFFVHFGRTPQPDSTYSTLQPGVTDIYRLLCMA